MRNSQPKENQQRLKNSNRAIHVPLSKPPVVARFPPNTNIIHSYRE